ncbi:pilus assembly protein TadG-related protein [Rothia sp. P100]|uniref:Rv3654c family TadE-like protein n=1 Tax=Rothia sp. P100 TaxID=2939578 RepID=UPI00203F798E|nr:Rv3654c family TadE-like protein [Rothia sp. P100]MCM3509788.1 pilus assembly protein TadG-related protein [Rothia sp. P100]
MRQPSFCLPREDAERGSNTVTSLGLVCVLLVLGLTVAGLVGIVSANHRAATAADLAALAGADAARGLSSGQPCTVAAAVAGRNGASLAGCALPSELSGTVDVRVTIPIEGPFAFLGSAEGLSRAGPPAVLVDKGS